jgi:hypothetical protein
MKLNLVLLATSILQTYAQEMELGTECYSKVDCKILKLMNDAINSGKFEECMDTMMLEDANKCVYNVLGLDKDQADLAWKIAPYARKCAPILDIEFDTCTVGCTKLKDRYDCLDKCTLPLRLEAEECLEELAGVSTENASKNAKCIMGCDKDTYAEIFDCQYKCRKNVFDALAAKDASKDYDSIDTDEEENSKDTGKDNDSKDSGNLDKDSNNKPTDEASKSSSSGSQVKPTGSSQPQQGSSGQSSAYLTSQASSLVKITLSILIASLFI